MAGELSWLERGTHKPEVSGSIPLPATKIILQFFLILQDSSSDLMEDLNFF